MRSIFFWSMVLALFIPTAAFVPSITNYQSSVVSKLPMIASKYSSPGLQILRDGFQPRLRTSGTMNLNMQIKGVYNDNSDKPKASKELLQIRFSSVDAPKLSAWLKKWPFGSKKDGFGLPKTMLPLSAEPYGAGVKIIFKGTADPWLQVDLEGDTIRVYRQSIMSTNFLQVSALKQREETKICDKLKEDLSSSDCGATGLIERAIPEVTPAKKEEAPADTGAAPTEEAPAA